MSVTNRGEAWTARQQRAPLFEALLRHARRDPRPFHVPGHKMGASFDGEARACFQSLLLLDLTELTGLDDLHQPEGVIAEAQALAAEAFGAEETRFLVGGSTAGNIALILAVCSPGDKIVVQRNCHKSVYHGLMLARAKPVFLVPAVDPVTGVAAGLRREDVERALAEHPEAKAVFLTNPTYYGMGIDLTKIAAAVHRYGVPLLVDEAHGAHYGFHPALPPSAMQCGADAAVQSTHKMGPAMTMASMLHVRGERIDRERLYRALAMIQSSSPSYPLMASLDVARRWLALEGRAALERVLPILHQLRSRLATLPWLRVPERTDGSVYTTQDPLKLMLCLHTRELSGLELQSYLEEAGIFPELAEVGHVLLAASAGTGERDVEQLWQALQPLSPPPLLDGETVFQTGLWASQFTRETVLPMHEAMDAPRRRVPLAQAIGGICGEMVVPYPPGIPLLVPGERIDPGVGQLLAELRRRKVRFHGVADPSLATVAVVERINRS